MGLGRIIWKHYVKVVVFLVLILLVLQGYHIMYLFHNSDQAKLRHLYSASLRASRSNISQPVKHLQTSNLESVSKLKQVGESQSPSLDHQLDMKYMQRLEHGHDMDKTGTYMIIPNLAMAHKTEEVNNILTLCTQTSSRNLKHIPVLSEVWPGPVSVTVFTYGRDVALTLHLIAYYHQCFKNVRDRFTFHVVYPLRNGPRILNWFHLKRCSDHLDPDSDLFARNYEETNIPYPHNVLRNVAITYSTTAYILMTDIDILPSQHLHSQFVAFERRKYLRNSQEKIVYVIPAFESNSNKTLLDKSVLANLLKSKEARPFYEKVCAHCQVVTDYERWMSLPNVSFLDIGYELEWESPWEPFYIAQKHNLPMYDGRFKQYGFNRISQVCELHMAGYSFAVLNNAFAVHQGFKEANQFHEDKDLENQKNKKLYKEYIEELKLRYPNTSRQC